MFHCTAYGGMPTQHAFQAAGLAGTPLLVIRLYYMLTHILPNADQMSSKHHKQKEVLLEMEAAGCKHEIDHTFICKLHYTKIQCTSGHHASIQHCQCLLMSADLASIHLHQKHACQLGTGQATKLNIVHTQQSKPIWSVYSGSSHQAPPPLPVAAAHV